MVSEVNKFTIVRSKWVRGKKKSTMMLNELGERDCLGFLLKASGFTDDQIIGAREPTDIIIKYDWNTKLVDRSGKGFCQNSCCAAIIATNDTDQLQDDVREHRLKDLFKLINIDVEFIE